MKKELKFIDNVADFECLDTQSQIQYVKRINNALNILNRQKKVLNDKLKDLYPQGVENTDFSISVFEKTVYNIPQSIKAQYAEKRTESRVNW